MKLRDSKFAAISILKAEIENLKEAYCQNGPPKNLRRATPSDVVENAVLWGKWQMEWEMLEVEEVIDPYDDFSTFYPVGSPSSVGLKNLWVEDVSPQVTFYRCRCGERMCVYRLEDESDEELQARIKRHIASCSANVRDHR